MICTWPGCTGVHDNNRFAELCPRSRRLHALKQQRYEAQSAVYVRRYLLALDRRRGGQIEALADLGGDVVEHVQLRDATVNGPIRQRNTERFLNRPRRERPKVPTICAGRGQVISVARVLTATHKPEVRWWVA
jgi:hypothetical protein